MLSNLEDLLLFTTIVDCGSLTAAAERLGMPKSRLSRRLAALEQQLGSQLLLRTTRRQQLTETGRLLYRRSQPHLEALSQVEEDVGSLVNTPRGKLRLLLPLEFFNRLISELICDFADRYPQIELCCSHYSGLMPGDTDNADLIFVLHESPLPASDWITRSLLSFPQSIYAAKQRDLAAIRTPADLARHPCILGADEHQWLFRDGDQLQAVPVCGRIVLSSPEMRLEAAAHNLGLIKLPDYLCHHSRVGEQLKPVPLSHAPQAQQLSVLYQSRSVPLKVRLFLEFFQSHLGRLS